MDYKNLLINIGVSCKNISVDFQRITCFVEHWNTVTSKMWVLSAL